MNTRMSCFFSLLKFLRTGNYSGKLKNDTIKKRAIVEWGLPLTYSELEKTDIENSISITAYHRTDIKSMEELITYEYLRKDPRETSLEVDTSSVNARIVYSTIKGLNYKGKIYFVFKNDIGYVITFMATPGTYDKNLGLFEDFNKKITFL